MSIPVIIHEQNLQGPRDGDLERLKERVEALNQELGRNKNAHLSLLCQYSIGEQMKFLKAAVSILERDLAQRAEGKPSINSRP